VSEDLPEGWAVASIQELVENKRYSLAIGPFGSNLKVIDYRESGRPLVFVREIRARRFQDNKTKYVSEEKFEELSAHRVAGGDLLITKMGNPPGDVAEYPMHLPEAVITADCIKMTVDINLALPLFAYFGLQSDFFRQQVLEISAGVAHQKVTLENFRNLRLPLAPIAEQRRIVAKLDALQSRTRIAREALDAVAPLLKSFRQSVLQAAVTGALTEEWRSKQRKLPEWEPIVVGDLLREKPRNGYSPRSVDQETNVKSLSLSATTSGRFRPECFKYIVESIPDDSHLWLNPGDILIQRANTIEYVGVSAIFDGPQKTFIYPDLMMKCRANSRTSPQYLHLLLSSGGVRQFYWDNATGTAGNMPKINQPTVMSAPADLPPLAEQTEIVRRVQHLFAMADAMEAEFAAAQRSVDQLDQSLLATAFRGELVPQDPSDEPASVLLERIRAARAALPETKGKRGRKASSDFDASMLMAAEPAAPKKRGRPAK
jgi:type I restriction enzyme S subunit